MLTGFVLSMFCYLISRCPTVGGANTAWTWCSLGCNICSGAAFSYMSMLIYGASYRVALCMTLHPTYTMPESKLLFLKVRVWNSPEESPTLGKLGQIRSQIAFLSKKYFIQTKPPKRTNFLHQMLNAKSKEVNILISRSIQWSLTDQPSD